jgi:integrase
MGAERTTRRGKGQNSQLTKTMIDALRADGDKRAVLWDAEIRGLHVICYPSGGKTFYLKYRTATGRQVNYKIGRYGSITLAQARRIARETIFSVAKGADPAKERKEARHSETIAELCDRFLKEHAARKKKLTYNTYAAIVSLHIVPALGSMNVKDVQTKDIARAVAAIGAEKPMAANLTAKVLHLIFELAETWQLRPQHTNPVHRIARYKETKRHRDLSELELVRLGKALNEAQGAHPHEVAAIRLLLFTGCRRNEVLNLKWSEVDIERRMLRIGESKTGSKTVHLNSAAVEVLEAQRKACRGVYVIPGPGADIGSHCMKPARLFKAWEKIRSAASLEARDDDGVRAFRLHDLRHNFASAGAGGGLSLHAIGSLLGHSSPSITARYADLAASPMQAAAELIGQKLSDAMKSADTAADH